MSSEPHRCRLLILATAVGLWLAATLAGQPMAPELSAVPDGGDSGENDCAGGVVLDDGSAETGYGWVPSVVEGEYVQAFDADACPGRRLKSVCICWLRTRPDTTLDFEIVFYRQVVDPDTDPEDPIRLIPDAEPYAVRPGSAEVIPKGVTESFFEVEVGDLVMPFGRSYIGARWDASTDQFFFICADTSEETEPVEVFFRDDRSEEGQWTSVFETTDPIFTDHKALMVRLLPGEEVAIDVPALGGAGLALLVAALAASALAVFWGRRRKP